MWWLLFVSFVALFVMRWILGAVLCWREARIKVLVTYGPGAWSSAAKRKCFRRAVFWFLPHRYVFPFYARRNQVLSRMRQEADDGQ